MPLTVPDPDLEIMGAGEGREWAGHPGPQFALKIRGMAPPPDSSPGSATG